MVEAIISVLILSMAVAAVFSVSISVRMGMRRAGVADEMHVQAQGLLKELQNYVAPRDQVWPIATRANWATKRTAPPTDVFTPPGDSPWHLPGDACGTANPGTATCWALAAGGDGTPEHDVTSRLPSYLANPPVSATLRYIVERQTVGVQVLRKVTVNMTWEAWDVPPSST